jgi:hypothetical protein
MIRVRQLPMSRSSRTATLQHSLLFLFLCRIDFAPSGVTGTYVDPAVTRPLAFQNPPKWIPKPPSRTFSLKNWPYGDGPS